jgi:excisionase family DNA binding protein
MTLNRVSCRVAGDAARPSVGELRNRAKAISVKEFTEIYGVGRTTAYALIASGEIETAKIGTRRLIIVKSVNSWLRANITKGCS